MKPMRCIIVLLFPVLLLVVPGACPAQTIEQLYKASIHVARGHQYMSMKLLEEAEKEFWKAVELDYNNLEARQGLGDVCRDNMLYDMAIENYQLVLDQQPDNVDIQYQIAQCHYANRDYDMAIIASQKTLSLDEQMTRAENIITQSRFFMAQQKIVNDSLLIKEQAALQIYKQEQESKEGAFVGKLLPGWRMIQTGTKKHKRIGYSILGATAAMMITGYQLRGGGQKAFDQAAETGYYEVFENRVDLGRRRYKIGNYFMNAAIGLIVVNLVDSFIFKGALLGGKIKPAKPRIPERSRDRPY
ncbi:MAG: hypothetical protein U9P14_00025 [Gemmatimonadota bacterium]|nr:hypothetical protein [Gemmatimonadota bacterium]